MVKEAANPRLASSSCLQKQGTCQSLLKPLYFINVRVTKGNGQIGARHGPRAPNGKREEEDDQVQHQERAEDNEETWAPLTYDIHNV